MHTDSKHDFLKHVDKSMSNKMQLSVQAIRNIYLTDDDEDDRIVFSEILFDADSTAIFWQFSSGQELMDVLGKSCAAWPDVLFLNVNMPLKNGFDCLREIRSRGDNLKDIKVIMYSTSANPDTIRTARELGADFYAVKPKNVTDLKKLLEKVLRMNSWEPAPDFVLNTF
ncbi:response regulator [Flavobacterium olei]|uniref:response regulator n=1 Tax=Flavobacterium olei TaxID=1886782 RepID=UPI00321A79FA